MHYLKVLLILLAFSFTTTKASALTKPVSGTINVGSCTISYNGVIQYNSANLITAFAGTITFGSGCSSSGSCGVFVKIGGYSGGTDTAITSLEFEFSGNSDESAEDMIQQDPYYSAFMDELNAIQDGL